MGWKNLKEHFGIGHIVQKGSRAIHIGSGFVSDIVTIDPETGVVSESSTFSGFLDEKYPALKAATPTDVKKLLDAPDSFAASLAVYTFEGGEIIEHKCEELGWPNVTHEGFIMHENRYSPDLGQVVQWAKRDVELAIKFSEEGIEQLLKDLAERRAYLDQAKADQAKLEATFPTLK